MHTTQATAIGSLTILLWSSLAVLTVLAAPLPAFLMNAVTFGIGGTAGLLWIAASGNLGKLRGIKLGKLAFGTAGLFGYHALYFSAMRLAPPAEAGLVNNLWPLLIVLFSGLLPGERLKSGHILGAVCAFGGVALILLGNRSADLPQGATFGFALAFTAAFVWAIYSLGSRRMAAVPTESVALFCLGTAALSIPCHLLWEETLWPATSTGWWALIFIGLGPVGLAFYTWDIGIKRGNIQLLGVLSYGGPLLSTLALILAGAATLSWPMIAAALLITLGAGLAARA